MSTSIALMLILQLVETQDDLSNLTLLSYTLLFSDHLIYDFQRKFIESKITVNHVSSCKIVF